MKEVEKAAEPLSSLRPLIFAIGQNSAGNWVAREKSRALKFVKFETGNRPYAVEWVNGVHELNAAATMVKSPEETAGSLERVRRATCGFSRESLLHGQ